MHYRSLVRMAYLRHVVVNRSRSVVRPPAARWRHSHGTALPADRYLAISDALRMLPDRQREAIVLRYYVDLDEAEAADAMGISRGAVKSHTARGMAALRAALEM